MKKILIFLIRGYQKWISLCFRLLADFIRPVLSISYRRWINTAFSREATLGLKDF